MNNKIITPNIIANVEFYSTENGGRNMPTPQNFLVVYLLSKEVITMEECY